MSTSASKSKRSAKRTQPPAVVPAADPFYLALVLDDTSRAMLLAWWDRETGTPRLPVLKGTHVALAYDPDPMTLLHYQKFVGEPGYIGVRGWASDDNGQVVLVDTVIPSLIPHPHVTIAVRGDTNTVYVNQLLTRGYTSRPGPVLFGVVRLLQ